MPSISPLAMKRKWSSPSALRGCRAKTEMTTLRPELWGDLPDEILEQIFSRLPVDSLIRCRRTCRKYNSLIMSGEWPSSSSPGKNLPLWCGSSDESVTTFNSRRNLWTKLSLDFLENDSQLALRHNHRKPVSLETAGGLVCLASTNSYFERLIVTVCNPITRRWRHILVPHSHLEDEADTFKSDTGLYYDKMECMYDSRVKLLGMAVDKQNNTYKVVVAGDPNPQGFFQSILIFDSATSCWELTDKASGAISVGTFHTISSVVSCNGNLYFLESGIRRRENRNPVMVKYDSESKSWSRKFAVPKDSQGRPCLIEHHGDIFCVARANRQTKRSGRQGLWIFYKFQESNDALRSSSWVKVSEMPAEVFEKLPLDQKLRPEDMTCVGQGDLVYFSSSEMVDLPELDPRTFRNDDRSTVDETRAPTVKRARAKSVLVHDLREKTWTWLPECPLPDDKGNSTGNGGTPHLSELRSFEPSLMDV